ncbi:LysM peptidoglycan-binding domain-containing protein [bacterium]|nr:LysM peptidoglycan-binding domain-containing protein [bacterium]
MIDLTGWNGRSRGRKKVRVVWSLVLCLSLGAVLSGCGTGGLAVKRDVWEVEEAFSQRQAGLSEKVLQIDGRVTAQAEEVTALRMLMEGLASRISGLDTEFGRGLEAIRSGQEQLGIELEGRIRTVDSGREDDREDLLARMQIVLEEVSRENAQLRKDIDELRNQVVTGYEHEVKRGETLATIASQYGVTINAIVRENNLANPDVISVGQKLFIPRG